MQTEMPLLALHSSILRVLDDRTACFIKFIIRKMEQQSSNKLTLVAKIVGAIIGCAINESALLPDCML